jgi:hypothetical protein
MMKRTCGILIAMSLAACVGEPVTLTSSFDPEAVRWAKETGTNEITGQAFLRQQGGGVVTCAGERVTLIPSSPYSTERIRAAYGNGPSGVARFMFGTRLPEPDPGFTGTHRTATCDAQGSFSFSGLPDGDYYLVTRVMWTVGNRIIPEGAGLMHEASLRDGQRANIIMTP